MTKIIFFILLFVGDNCFGFSEIVKKEIKESVQFCQLNNKLLERLLTSVDQLRASVAQNTDHINDLHNQSSSNSEMFALKFDEMQKHLTEQDQKKASISEDLQKASVNQLSEENNETSFILSNTQETEKILIRNISEDHEDAILKSQQEAQNLSVCKDVFNLGENISTSYLLPKFREVLCNMTTDGGGWLVIQKRQKVTKQVDFNRTWASYKEGFGDLDTEFWIGNEFLHRITNQKSYELRIDVEDFEDGRFYATYSEFRVGNEESGYQLHLGGFEGNVYDRLKDLNNMKFSTFDRDNDKFSGNCAERNTSGFWYKHCAGAYLNGLYPTVPDRKNKKAIHWWDTKERLILINVEMKIRPKQ